MQSTNPPNIQPTVESRSIGSLAEGEKTRRIDLKVGNDRATFDVELYCNSKTERMVVFT